MDVIKRSAAQVESQADRSFPVDGVNKAIKVLINTQDAGVGR